MKRVPYLCLNKVYVPHPAQVYGTTWPIVIHSRAARNIFSPFRCGQQLIIILGIRPHPSSSNRTSGHFALNMRLEYEQPCSIHDRKLTITAACPGLRVFNRNIDFETNLPEKMKKKHNGVGTKNSPSRRVCV